MRRCGKNKQARLPSVRGNRAECGSWGHTRNNRTLKEEERQQSVAHGPCFSRLLRQEKNLPQHRNTRRKSFDIGRISATKIDASRYQASEKCSVAAEPATKPQQDRNTPQQDRNTPQQNATREYQKVKTTESLAQADGRNQSHWNTNFR